MNDTENATPENGGASDAAQAGAETQAPVSEPTAETSVKRGPGRPPLSPEEKAKRAAEREQRKAQEKAVLAQVSEAHPPPAAPEAKPAFKPTKEQIARAENAVARTWETLEGLILGLACKDVPGKPLPEPDAKRAKDVGEAWGELLAEALPNADATIRITVATITTASCATGAVMAVKKHNAQAPKPKALPPKGE